MLELLAIIGFVMVIILAIGAICITWEWLCDEHPTIMALLAGLFVLVCIGCFIYKAMR